MSKLTGKPATGGPGVGQKYKPQADIQDPRGGDTWPMDNIGSGRATEVRDRQPRKPLTPDYGSVERSLKGKGLNDCTQLESMREFLNKGPELSGDTDGLGGLANQDLRGIGGRGRV